MKDIYQMAAYFARRIGCDTIIDVSFEHHPEFVKLNPEFQLLGINLSGQTAPFSSIKRPLWDDTHDAPMPAIPVEQLKNSVLVCAGAIERLRRPEKWLSILRTWQKYLPLALISTPDRSRQAVTDATGASFQISRWNLSEFGRFLAQHNLAADQVGYVKSEIVAILRPKMNIVTPPPERFRVLAIMATYNDEDVILPVLSHLTRDGIYVYVMDNWSTDRTWERLLSFRETNPFLVGLERFPQKPSEHYLWTEILKRKEEIALEIPADWYMHVDSDEVRRSPWAGFSLRDAIYQVDQEGYNAIEFAVLNFYPTDASDYPDQADPERYFKYFAFGDLNSQRNPQVKTWKSQSARVDLSMSGGHSVTFENRRIYLYKFLLKHYSIRSKAHGEKKIFQDRISRIQKEYTERNWHGSHDKYQPGYQFYRTPDGLYLFDKSFYVNLFTERLTGLGLD